MQVVRKIEDPFEQVELTFHAVKRYRERVRPTLSISSASKEMRQLMALSGKWAKQPPEWSEIEHQENARYIVLTEEIFLILHPGTYTVATCFSKNLLNAKQYTCRQERRDQRIKKQKQKRNPRTGRKPSAKDWDDLDAW